MTAPKLQTDKLNIIIYGRYSKDDQNQASVDDQILLCRDWLEFNGHKDAEITTERDEGISGEKLSRPGIDRVREMIATNKYDILIGEEVSRFFRDRSEPHKLAGECLDNGTRLICINDNFDTDHPKWESDLSRACEEHAGSNEKTAFRINRASQGRWKAGYAMGPLVPGYTRIIVDPDRHKETGRGPYRDEKDEQWVSVIVECFERAARGDTPGSIADYLTGKGFPRPHNSNKAFWTSTGLKQLLKNPVFKGVEQFRVTHSKKHYGSGRHVPERSAPQDVWTRERPDLAMVTPLLWEQANDARRQRDLGGRHPAGKDNSTYRIPRESRSPLSNHFYCGICGSKMIGQGRDEGGYRCGGAIRGQCWNKATVKRGLTHEAIFGAVAGKILGQPEMFEALVEMVHRLGAAEDDTAKQKADLERKIQDLEKHIDKCGQALIANPASEYLSGRLKNAEASKSQLSQSLRALEAAIPSAAPKLSVEAIRDAATEAARGLWEHDREAGLLLRQLTTPIKAVPFQRIDCGLVVMRARFRVNLIALLPSHWQRLLRAAEIDLDQSTFISEDIVLDLFESPDPVKHAKPALALRREGLPARDISVRLGLSRRTVYDAIALAELMEQQGLTEPYVELTGRPASASRWRDKSIPQVAIQLHADY